MKITIYYEINIIKGGGIDRKVVFSREKTKEKRFMTLLR